MIHFDNITFGIHGKTLLEQTGLQVQAGDKVVIRGPSGSGKSSLLKTAAGLLPILEGSISVDGIPLSAETVAEIRGRISYIGQEPVLGAENVRDALLLPFQFKIHQDKQPSDEQILQTLERLCLTPDILKSDSKRISGGEKQRIAIARALLLNKTIFMADEITSALDPESKTAVMAELFRPENTILSVSHDPDWIQACSRIIKLKNRHLVEVEK